MQDACGERFVNGDWLPIRRRHPARLRPSGMNALCACWRDAACISPLHKLRLNLPRRFRIAAFVNLFLDLLRTTNAPASAIRRKTRHGCRSCIKRSRKQVGGSRYAFRLFPQCHPQCHSERNSTCASAGRTESKNPYSPERAGVRAGMLRLDKSLASECSVIAQPDRDGGSLWADEDVRPYARTAGPSTPLRSGRDDNLWVVE